MKFNHLGNLEDNVPLTYAAFKKQFGFTETRTAMIERALIFIKIFRSLGCSAVYITGSFVTDKHHPNDLDLCIDASGLDYRTLANEYPEFLTSRGIEKIRKEHRCHFAAIFDNDSKSILDKYKVDRSGNPRSFVKLDLKDLECYDQERKTI